MRVRSSVILLVVSLGLGACGGSDKPGSRPRDSAPDPEPDAAAAPDRAADSPALDTAGPAPDGPSAEGGGPGDASGGPDDVAPAADGRADGAAAPDGPPRDVAPSTVPVLTAVSPGSAVRAASLNLEVTGTGFADGAVVVFGGFSLATTRVSDTLLRGAVTIARTSIPGQHAVWIENRTMPTTAVPASQRSNTLYFTVTTTPGAPEVLDYSPDHGVAGGKFQLVGFNLTHEAVRVVDRGGRMAVLGPIGTASRVNVILETVEVTVPAGWQTGPLTVSNSMGMFQGKLFNVGRNLAVGPGVKPTASTEYGGEWTIVRGADNDLVTSWFSAAGNCVSLPPPMCVSVPFFMVTFPAAETVGRIAIRGNRQYANGYDFLRGKFEILGAGGAVLWSQSAALPEPDRDLDIVLPMPVPNALSVRFTSEADESTDPGFAELEVFGP